MRIDKAGGYYVSGRGNWLSRLQRLSQPMRSGSDAGLLGRRRAAARRPATPADGAATGPQRLPAGGKREGQSRWLEALRSSTTPAHTPTHGQAGAQRPGPPAEGGTTFRGAGREGGRGGSHGDRVAQVRHGCSRAGVEGAIAGAREGARLVQRRAARGRQAMRWGPCEGRRADRWRWRTPGTPWRWV
jgi:hypothetical protein